MEGPARAVAHRPGGDAVTDADDLPDCGTLTGLAATVLLTALGWAFRKAEP